MNPFTLLKTLIPRKHVDVSPPDLAEILAAQIFRHYQGISQLCRKLHFPMEDETSCLVFQQITGATYAIAKTLVVNQSVSSDEITAYGSALLKETRNALTRLNLMDPVMEWLRSDERFRKTNEQDQTFFFRDEVSHEQSGPLSLMMKHCRCEKKNSPIYRAVKLQFRLCSVLGKLSSADSLFEPLWKLNLKMTRSFSEGTLKNLLPAMD